MSAPGKDPVFALVGRVGLDRADADSCFREAPRHFGIDDGALAEARAQPIEHRRHPESTASPTLRTALISFGAIAVAILAASPMFAYWAKQIAELTGIGHTFMGTWLVGLSTSLPELVACVAAVRMGAYDLAVGNLFGSNAFNMAVFFAMDIAHPGGSVFGALDPGHALSALFATVLMALGLGAIVFRSEKRWAGLEPDAVLMLVTYAISILMLYNLTGSG